MKNCRYGPRHETVEAAAKRRYPHMALGMGKAVLLFTGDPHRQWSLLVRHERTPSPVNFAAIGHEALRLLSSPDIGLSLDNVGRFGPRHAKALAEYWLTYGIRGKALELRMAVLRCWARWVGYPEAAPVVEDVVRELNEEVCHG
jgi:hypothetical protein